MPRPVPKPEDVRFAPEGPRAAVDVGPQYTAFFDQARQHAGDPILGKRFDAHGRYTPESFGAGSDVLRWLAAQNGVSPGLLASQATGDQIRGMSPTTAVGNFYDLYTQGVTPDQVQDPNMPTPVPGIQGPMLGAAPQQFAAGGMVGQPQQQPMLALGFAAGGQIPPAAPTTPGAPGGMPAKPGLQPAQAGQRMTPQMADAHINDMLQRNPQIGQQIQQIVTQGIQTGQINPQMAQIAVQLAQACLQNPDLWPQLRQFAISRGLAGPNDLPQQYDEGLVLTILIAARAANGQMGQGPGVNSNPQYAAGGMIVGPGTGTSDSIQTQNRATGQPVSVSTGEYIIPARVVEMKGKEFFDQLVQKYNGQPANGAAPQR